MAGEEAVQRQSAPATYILDSSRVDSLVGHGALPEYARYCSTQYLRLSVVGS